MKITIGSDHGAVELKEEVKKVLAECKDIEVRDVGTFTTDSVDYPDIAEKVCADVTSGAADRGIVMLAVLAADHPGYFGQVLRQRLGVVGEFARRVAVQLHDLAPQPPQQRPGSLPLPAW